MRELHGHAGVRALLANDGLAPCLLLEGDDILVELMSLRVVSHVQQTEADLSQAGLCHHVVAASDDAAYQLVGQGFTRLIVEGEGLQEVLLHGIVLHELRRQLYEVPPHVGTAETLEAGVGKHAVQRMAELMEERLHLAQRQQCRLVVRRLRQIHHHRHVRPHVLTFLIYILSLVFGHPCPTLLAFAWMEISIEDGEVRAVLVEHLVGFHVGVIDGYVLVLLERDAIQAVCQSEDAVDDLVQLEVGTQHLGIYIIFLQFQLVRIEGGVPGLHLLALALPSLLGKAFQFALLFQCSGTVGIYQVVEQTVDTLHIARHAVFQHIVGIGLESQQLCYLAAQVHQSLADVQVVGIIVVYALRVLRHIHLPAQFTLRAVGHKRRVRGEVEGEHPSVQLPLSGLQSGGVNSRLWQAVQLLLVRDVQHEGFVFLQHVLREL